MSEKGLRAEPVRAVPEEKKIRNRDILLLSRIFYTMADITSLEQRRTWQRERMFSMTQNLSGMPRGGSGRGGTDNALAALETLDERQAMLVRSYTRELHEVERILNGIPSRTMRSFVLMMYVDQLPPYDSEGRAEHDRIRIQPGPGSGGAGGGYGKRGVAGKVHSGSRPK